MYAWQCFDLTKNMKKTGGNKREKMATQRSFFYIILPKIVFSLFFFGYNIHTCRRGVLVQGTETIIRLNFLQMTATPAPKFFFQNFPSSLSRSSIQALKARICEAKKQGTKFQSFLQKMKNIHTHFSAYIHGLAFKQRVSEFFLFSTP